MVFFTNFDHDVKKKQYESLNFQDRFDILLEMKFSGVAEQEYTMLWKSQILQYKWGYRFQKEQKT